MAFAFLLASCGGDKGSSVDPPADFKVVAGDSSVIVTWTAEPETDYWIFFGPGTNVNRDNWVFLGGVVITGAVSPRIITGLANGTTYSFTINGRKNKGPGGPGAPTQIATPQVAGANWAPNAPLGTQRLNAVAATTLVTGFTVAAVGEGGKIFTSVNLAPMTERTNPAPGFALNGVWSGVLGFVAGGPNGTLLHSFDGITWTQRTSGTTQTIYAGAGAISTNYVAVGAGGMTLHSADAIEWTSQGAGDHDLYGACYGFNRFVAVGAAGSTQYSTDGSNWAGGAVVTDKTLRAVAYALLPGPDGILNQNLFVAVGDNGAFQTSTDGQGWTLQTPFTTQNLRAITYGGRFVAVGEDGALFISTNGLDWTPQASNTTVNLNGVARQLTGYTAVGDGGTNISTF
jgi:hypothetical protein